MPVALEALFMAIDVLCHVSPFSRPLLADEAFYKKERPVMPGVLLEMKS
jgi:hypothetical protein